MARDSASTLEQRTLALEAESLYRDPDIYDQLYRRRSEDIAFYVEAARRYGGPVLELGAGSGRITCAIANAGVEVFGIERMPSMLANATRRRARLPLRARSLVELRRADVRSLRVKRRFPLVLAPFNVLMHMYSRRDLARALETCRVHLAPRGRLILDVLMPDMAALAQDPNRLYRVGRFVHPKTHAHYVLREGSSYDPVRQVRTILMVLEPDDQSAAPIAIPLAHRQFFPLELEGALEAAGFRIEARYGDFKRRLFDAQAESQIVIARAT